MNEFSLQNFINLYQAGLMNMEEMGRDVKIWIRNINGWRQADTTREQLFDVLDLLSHLLNQHLQLDR